VHLRYAHQKGFLVVTTTTDDVRMREALEACGPQSALQLTTSEIEQLDAAGATFHWRRFWADFFSAGDTDAGLL
jgi:diketogulonate reductase-like aldo/keto reductase